jgi:DNA polymerase kappa
VVPRSCGLAVYRREGMLPRASVANYVALLHTQTRLVMTRALCAGGLGMISTANYVARKYGVRSAMPGFIGKELCAKPAPGSRLEASKLVFVKPDFTKYVAISEQVKALLKEHFDPYLQSGGIDEAYLDVTEYMRTHAKTPVEVAEEIRACIREATYSWPGAAREVSGLTCSCGVAPNRRLAKICSDINKPDGQYVLEASREHILDFVSSLPIRKVAYGIHTSWALHVSSLARQCGASS